VTKVFSRAAQLAQLRPLVAAGKRAAEKNRNRFRKPALNPVPETDTENPDFRFRTNPEGPYLLCAVAMLQYGRASAEKSRQSHHPAGRYQPDFHGPGVRQPQALSTLFGERRGAQALKLPILSGANPRQVIKMFAAVHESGSGRYCCKSPKLPGINFPAVKKSDLRPPIDVASITLPRSPVSLSSGDDLYRNVSPTAQRILGKSSQVMAIEIKRFPAISITFPDKWRCAMRAIFLTLDEVE
jgi:hypothetical protein